MSFVYNMETLDLDINNYDLADLLNLFKMNSNFGEKDLKQAKQIVLKMHPDKSGLDQKYFLFFSHAYKILHSMYIFKNRNEKKIQNNDDFSYEKILHDVNVEKEHKIVLDNFFNTNKKLHKDKHFNEWFNEHFEKGKIRTDHVDKGYGDWLKSNEDLEENSNVSFSQIAVEIEKKKKKIAQQNQLINRDRGIEELETRSFGTDLTDDAPQEYNSDLFSALSYQDLKKAHKESIIPVCNDDYQEIQKFNNVDDYIQYRNHTQQSTKLLSEEQSLQYLQQRKNVSDLQSTERAYKLAKQMEEVTEKNKQFWSNIYKLKN
jgi:hypothetical protein